MRTYDNHMTVATRNTNPEEITDAPSNPLERAVAAVIGWWWRPRRRHVMVASFMLGLLVINPSVFIACTLVLALLADLLHGGHTVNSIRRVRIVHERYRKATARTTHKSVAAYRAVRPEVSVTPLQRERRKFTRMCEVRNITPIPTVTAADRTDSGRKLTLRLNAAGMTVDQFRKHSDSIAHYFGKGVIDVRVANHPKHKSMCFLYIDERDLLADSLGPWPNLTTPIGSRSVVDKLLVGVTGGKIDVTLDVRNDAAFIAGQRGTGKSSFLQQIVAGAAQCHDVDLWLGDMKEGAEFYAWADKVARFADSPDAAERMIRDLLTERERRSRALVARKLRKWEPGCGFPFILLVIDEAAELTMGGDDSAQSMLTKIVRLGRAQGIGVILATQRPSADWISTSLRAQCNVGISFRVRDATENSVALGPGAGELGLHAHRLPKHQFLMLGNDEQDGVRCRGWFLSDAEVETLAAQLPTRVPAVEDGPVRSDTDLTPEDPHIEPLGGDGRQMSDRIEPPAAIAANPKHLALWDALPAATAAEAGSRAGYSRQHAGMLLRSWAERGLVVESWDGWRHGDSTAEIGGMA